jgi:ketosteroid isomerase-like protein
MNSIRSMTASLAFVVALTTSTSIQAQSVPSRYARLAETGTSSIATKQQQDDVMRLMVAYLGLWLAEDPSRYAFEQFVTENAVFEYPYADEAFRHIEGRDAIGQALRKLPLLASNWKFVDLKRYDTLYPNIFFIEYTANAYVPATQRTYESRHLARVAVRDGKIADYYELWEHDAKTVALGTTGQSDLGSIAQCTMPVRN